jgi:hypothetical protein
VSISFTQPIGRAWDRTQRMLFRPFRAGTWFVLGFAAFLSEWLSGNGFNGGNRVDADQVRGGIDRVRDLIVLIPLAVMILGGLLLLLILFQWLSARGKFVFLDGVVRERAAIVEPWGRLARVANSLFWWRLGFTIAVVSILIFIAIPFIPAIKLAVDHLGDPFGALTALAGLLLIVVPFLLLVGFVSLLLNDFVVPVMYRDGISANSAWGRFLPLFGRYPLHFAWYAIVVFLISIVVAAAVLAIGFATCCVGFVLLALPYIGQVVMLPIYVLYRGLGPEFLRQFGPEWDVFAVAPAAGGAPPPGGAIAPPPPPAPPAPPSSYAPPSSWPSSYAPPAQAPPPAAPPAPGEPPPGGGA